MKNQTRTTIASLIIIGVTVFTIISLNYVVQKISEKTPPTLTAKKPIILEEAEEDIAKPNKKPMHLEKFNSDEDHKQPLPKKKKKKPKPIEPVPEAKPNRNRNNNGYGGQNNRRYENGPYPNYPSYPSPYPPNMSDEERRMMEEQMEEHRMMMEEMRERDQYYMPPPSDEWDFYDYDNDYDFYDNRESKRRQKFDEALAGVANVDKIPEGDNPADTDLDEELMFIEE